MQDSGGIRAHLDACTDSFKAGRLLEYMGHNTLLAQCVSSGQAADARSYDCDGDLDDLSVRHEGWL